MSILRRSRVQTSSTARTRNRTRRAIARALTTAPTEATRQELLALEARL